MPDSMRHGLPLSLVAALAITLPAAAAISPGNVKRMKAKCSDVVEISITKVTIGETEIHTGYTRTEVIYTAEVKSVDRSASKVKAGDKIDFESYHQTGIPEPGPRSPDLLSKGWKGTVFLNKTKEGKFKIGVFGHSFEASPKEKSEDEQNKNNNGG